jgi:hypothetical protein
VDNKQFGPIRKAAKIKKPFLSDDGRKDKN